ncbi:MAG: inorganic phosphate transporter [Chloroflexota bacterium]
MEILLFVTIAVALFFDFTNGFHDTANAIATSISTRALSPGVAVLLSAVFNLVGALVTVFVFGGKVSNTIGKLLAFKVGLTVIIAALMGAIAWNLLTWYLGLPSSSSHALIGGLLGAAIAATHSLNLIRWSAFTQVLTYLVVSPIAGFIVAAIFMTILFNLVAKRRPAPLNRAFRLMQAVTACFVSYSHGSNDAQKTMAAMTLALIATGHATKFEPPAWVIVLAATAIGFGTYAGGWRIIRTLGWRIYKLDPATGFGAQLMGASVIQVATQLGFPVSTTHVVTGSVMGAGAPRQLTALKWGVGANIVAAWLVTIPAAAAVAWVAYAILHTAGLNG